MSNLGAKALKVLPSEEKNSIPKKALDHDWKGKVVGTRVDDPPHLLAYSAGKPKESHPFLGYPNLDGPARMPLKNCVLTR